MTRASRTPTLIRIHKHRNNSFWSKTSKRERRAPVFVFFSYHAQRIGLGVGEAAAGVVVFAGVPFDAGAALDAGAGAGVLGGGFTGTFDFVGVLALLAPATAFRTAATNGSPAAGAGTDPVKMLLNSNMRP